MREPVTFVPSTTVTTLVGVINPPSRVCNHSTGGGFPKSSCQHYHINNNSNSYFLLFTIYYLLFTIYYLLCAICYLWLIIYLLLNRYIFICICYLYLLFAAYKLLFIVYHLLFNIYYLSTNLLFTVYYLRLDSIILRVCSDENASVILRFCDSLIPWFYLPSTVYYLPSTAYYLVAYIVYSSLFIYHIKII